MKFSVEFTVRGDNDDHKMTTIHEESDVSNQDIVNIEAMMFSLLEARKQKGEALAKK